jgi:hypothetical protein
VHTCASEYQEHPNTPITTRTQRYSTLLGGVRVSSNTQHCASYGSTK